MPKYTPNVDQVNKQFNINVTKQLCNGATCPNCYDKKVNLGDILTTGKGKIQYRLCCSKCRLEFEINLKILGWSLHDQKLVKDNWKNISQFVDVIVRKLADMGFSPKDYEQTSSSKVGSLDRSERDVIQRSKQPTGRRGRRSEYSRKERFKYVEEWEQVKTDPNDARTLAVFLVDKVGAKNPDSIEPVPSISESTFYTWRKEWLNSQSNK